MSFDECSRKAVRRSDGEGGHELAGAGASGRDGVRVLGGGRAAGQRRRAVGGAAGRDGGVRGGRGCW